MTKYIIFDNAEIEIPIVFPTLIQHKDMAAMVKTKYPDAKPISAGFCRLVDEKLVCGGDSVSLQLKPRPEDSELLTQLFKNPDFI